jgi:hypothetical protein
VREREKERKREREKERKREREKERKREREIEKDRERESIRKGAIVINGMSEIKAELMMVVGADLQKFGRACSKKGRCNSKKGETEERVRFSSKARRLRGQQRTYK